MADSKVCANSVEITIPSEIIPRKKEEQDKEQEGQKEGDKSKVRRKGEIGRIG